MSSERRPRATRVAAWTLGLAVATYLVIVPGAEAIFNHFRPSVASGGPLEDLSIAEAIQLRCVEAIVVVWFFSLGATFGSFLNVVVYRVPRGESLIWQSSHCPSCGTSIETRDNIPILGWMKLGGRCRKCHAAISPRYPLVEGGVAAVFLLFLFVELLTGGENIPRRMVNSHTGVVWIVLYTKWDLVRLYLLHCYLISMLLGWALIDFDRHAVPVRAAVVTTALVVLASVLWPDLQPVPTDGVVTASALVTSWNGFSRSVMGGVVGVLTGVAIQHVLARRGSPAIGRTVGSLWAGLMLVGSVLGWQAAVVVAGLTLALRILSAVGSRVAGCPPLWQASGDLWLGTVLTLLAWRTLDQRLCPWCFGAPASAIRLAATTTVLLLLLQVARRCSPCRPDAEPSVAPSPVPLEPA